MKTKNLIITSVIAAAIALPAMAEKVAVSKYWVSGVDAGTSPLKTRSDLANQVDWFRGTKNADLANVALSKGSEFKKTQTKSPAEARKLIANALRNLDGNTTKTFICDNAECAAVGDDVMWCWASGVNPKSYKDKVVFFFDDLCDDAYKARIDSAVAAVKKAGVNTALFAASKYVEARDAIGASIDAFKAGVKKNLAQAIIGLLSDTNNTAYVLQVSNDGNGVTSIMSLAAAEGVTITKSDAEVAFAQVLADPKNKDNEGLKAFCKKSPKTIGCSEFLAQN